MIYCQTDKTRKDVMDVAGRMQGKQEMHLPGNHKPPLTKQTYPLSLVSKPNFHLVMALQFAVKQLQYLCYGTTKQNLFTYIVTTPST